MLGAGLGLLLRDTTGARTAALALLYASPVVAMFVSGCSSVDNTIWYGPDGGTGTFSQNSHPGAGSDTPPAWGRIKAVPKPPPESTKTSLRQRLTNHAKAHGPDLAAVNVRHRGMSPTSTGNYPPASR